MVSTSAQKPMLHSRCRREVPCVATNEKRREDGHLAAERKNEQIARRAYERYQQRGEHGHDLEDWLQAERDLDSVLRDAADGSVETTEQAEIEETLVTDQPAQPQA
jgi:hypothetical protein